MNTCYYYYVYSYCDCSTSHYHCNSLALPRPFCSSCNTPADLDMLTDDSDLCDDDDDLDVDFDDDLDTKLLNKVNVLPAPTSSTGVKVKSSGEEKS